MSIDLDVLESIARHAADEPWSAVVSGPDVEPDEVQVVVSEGRDWPVIAHHVHMFRPENALQLIAAARERDALREAMPDLTAVIQWLHNGCDPVHAVTELSVLKGRIDRARQSIAPNAGEPK